MKIAVTGADGFIGRNLILRLAERKVGGISRINRSTSEAELIQGLLDADFIFHLAGVNRPQHVEEFGRGNKDFTAKICNILVEAGKSTPVLYASSTQAGSDNAYGQSKRAAEKELATYGINAKAPVAIYRLTNVFGKWARPNYNSAVATFCHNIARGLPITVNDPTAPLRLVYIDDVVAQFLDIMESRKFPADLAEVDPVYETSVGEVADIIRGFADGRSSLMTQRVGTGLTRALHATYLSSLPQSAFSYRAPVHADQRGEFVEVLKTPDCGQFSYFTAHPGVTRGEHYHHTKTEKFAVIRGQAQFGFRNVDTGEHVELTVSGGSGEIVETPPGWAHNITNIGDDELIVMLWANEVFDRERPDTIAARVKL
jgi:UDP-2-acetamido-2,6-beta-L-arabino-hexul-4-ose reductase